MSPIYDSTSHPTDVALALAPGPQPWYATAPAPPVDRQALEDEHTRVLARAVGDHLPYELVLRAGELAARLQQIA